MNDDANLNHRLSDNGAGRLSMMTVGMFAACVCYAFIVLNRWAVTDLGLLSIGRVWQLYVSYMDFGFLRRSFVGTVLTETRVNTLFANEYVFAIVVQGIAIVLIALLTAAFCLKEKIANPVFLFGVAFSPAFIIHSGYTTGSLDVFVLLLAVINIFYVKNILVFSGVIVCGVLTHELFLFTVPAQFLALYLRRGAEPTAKTLAYSVPLISAAIAAVCVLFLGKVTMPVAEFERLIGSRIPNAVENHSHWSGYFEVGSTVETNFLAAEDLFAAITSGQIVFLLLPLLYVAVLGGRAISFTRSRRETAMLVAAIATPLLTALIALDYHRWIAMSANMALLTTLLLVSREGTTHSKWNMPVAFFCVLAPFGAAELERPFPLHQFLFEKLLA